MIWYWISFVIIALLIPVGLASFKIWATKNKNYTDKQKKHADMVLFKYCLFYWLCDLFYMSWFIDSLVCEFVFGLLIMIITMMSVCSSFVSASKKTNLQKWSLLQDFIVGVGLSVYLIYLIPDKELQTIIIAIVASLYGGLLTLAGVAWTIRKSDSDRKEDEIANIKPFFTFQLLSKEPKMDGPIKTCFPDPDNEADCKYEAYAQIDNSDFSLLTLKRIYHDGHWIGLHMNQTLLPGGNLILSFRCTNLLNVYLEVADRLGNSYFYKIEMIVLPNPLNPSFTSSGLKFCTIRGLKEISEEQMNKEIMEADFHD